MRLNRFEWACVGVIGLAFAVRLERIGSTQVLWDSAWYLLLARSFGETGTFLVPWTDPPTYSGYWPPLYPILLSPLVKVLGPSYSTLALGAILGSAFLVAATFVCTRDLFDRPRAFAAAALVAANPAFFTTDWRGMSESVLALFALLALWAFIKSLERPAFLALAAVFAALTYLAKATVGLPLVALGLAALLVWRVRVRGWRNVVRSRVDVGVAASAALLLVAAYVTRSERLGGVGVGIIGPLREAVLTPTFAPVLVFKLAFAAAFLFIVTLPLSIRFREAIVAARSERTDAMWLAALLPLVAGAFFTASFYITERRPLVDFDNIRYLTPSIVPTLWLLLGVWPLDATQARPEHAENVRLRRRHDLAYGAAIVALGVLALLNPLSAVAGSLGRFVALGVLALVPLGLATFAIASRFKVTRRETAKRDETYRYQRDPGGMGPQVAVIALLVALLVAAAFLPSFTGLALLVPALVAVAAVAYAFFAPSTGRRIVAVAAGGLVLTYFIAAWFFIPVIGAVVALAASAPRVGVAAMALVLVCHAAPQSLVPLPFDEVGRGLEALPDGAVVGTYGQVVYVAAVTPAHVDLRPLSARGEPPLGVDLVLAPPSLQNNVTANWTRVDAWAFTKYDSPPVIARQWIEERVLGRVVEPMNATAFALYARPG